MSYRHTKRTFSAEFYDTWKGLRDSYLMGIPKSAVGELFRTAERHLSRTEGPACTLNKAIDRRKRIVALALDAQFPKKAILGAVEEVWGCPWKERLGLQGFDSSEPMIDTLEDIASVVSGASRNGSKAKKMSN
jgi:hypothetical protein